MLTSETYASAVEAITSATLKELKRQNSLGVFTQAPLVKETYDMYGSYTSTVVASTTTHPATHTDTPVIYVGKQQKVEDSPFEETFFITDLEEDNLTAVHVTHAFTTGVGYVSAPLEKLVITDDAT